jgi:hypothetical protein
MTDKTCENDDAFRDAATDPVKLCVNFLYKVGDKDSNDISTIAENMTKKFYKQMSDYDFKENKAKTGKTLADVAHFTAMIWKGTGTEADKKVAVNLSAFAI